MRNKAEFDEDRLREWRERKRAYREDTKLKELYLEEQAREELRRAEDEAKGLRDRELDE